MINLLDYKPNLPSKFRTEKWVKINDDVRERYNANSKIKFKTSLLKSSLSDHSNAYMLALRDYNSHKHRNSGRFI